jgi:hypothetical protein
MIDRRRQRHMGRAHDEGVQLVRRRSGMGAHLRDERDMPLRGVDAVRSPALGIAIRSAIARATTAASARPANGPGSDARSWPR